MILVSLGTKAGSLQELTRTRQTSRIFGNTRKLSFFLFFFLGNFLRTCLEANADNLLFDFLCFCRTATGESSFSFSILFQTSCLYPSVAECDLEANGKNHPGKWRLLPCNTKQNLERGRDDMELTTDNRAKWTQGKSRQAYLGEDLEDKKCK